MRAFIKINPKKPKHSKESLFHDNVLQLLETLGRNYPNGNVIDTTKTIIECVDDDNAVIDKICRDLLKQKYDLKDNIRNDAITIITTIRSIRSISIKKEETTTWRGVDVSCIKDMRLEKMTIGEIAQKMHLPYGAVWRKIKKNGWN